MWPPWSRLLRVHTERTTHSRVSDKINTSLSVLLIIPKYVQSYFQLQCFTRLSSEYCWSRSKNLIWDRITRKAVLKWKRENTHRQEGWESPSSYWLFGSCLIAKDYARTPVLWWEALRLIHLLDKCYCNGRNFHSLRLLQYFRIIFLLLPTVTTVFTAWVTPVYEGRTLDVQ